MAYSPTVISSWVSAMAFGLEQCGVNTAALLPRCGLDPAKLEEKHARLPVRTITRIWEKAIAQTGEADLGLKVAEHFQIGAMHALGSALLTSASCAEACRRIERYFPLISNAGGCVITEGDGWVDIFIYSPWQGELVHHADIDLALAATLKFLCQLTSNRFKPEQVDLARPIPPDTSHYERIFGCPVQFAQEENRVRFNQTSWQLPLPGGDLELSEISDQLIEQYLQHLETDPLVTQVRGEILERLPGGEPALAQVAAKLLLSPRSLQRKLEAAGTSFAGVIRSTREELANSYLGDSRYSLKEIAFMLGFSDQANFNRAFKKWYGVSPGVYRRQLAEKTRRD